MGPMFGLHSDALGPAEGSLDLDGIRLLSSLHLSSSSPSIKSLDPQQCLSSLFTWLYSSLTSSRF